MILHQTFFVALNQTSVLFILMASGLIVRKLKIVDDRFSKSLSDLIMNLLLPALVLQVMDIPFSTDMLARGGVMILAGIGVYLVA